MEVTCNFSSSLDHEQPEQTKEEAEKRNRGKLQIDFHGEFHLPLLTSREEEVKEVSRKPRLPMSFSPPPPPPLPGPEQETPANGSAVDSHPEPLPNTHHPPLLSQPPPSKRQRRPSVRLGDIGEQPTSLDHHRRPKSFKSSSKKEPTARYTSKKRLLTHVEVHGSGVDEIVSGEERRSGGRDEQVRRFGGPISRLVRTSWFSSKVEDDGEEEKEDMDLRKSSGDEENYRNYDEEMVREDSFSPRREQSRVRVLDSRGVRTRRMDNVELDIPSETGGRNWDFDGGRNGMGEIGGGGVRVWLNGLGLGRYASVFEVHEVDEEVLPLLTLEDLKDMGINAVGSRRKMFSAIQKLRKNIE